MLPVARGRVGPALIIARARWWGVGRTSCGCCEARRRAVGGHLLFHLILSGGGRAVLPVFGLRDSAG